MVSGGGLEYIVIRPPESTVVSRPWDLSPLPPPPPPPESGEVSPTPNGASCGDGPLGRFRPIRALLRGGEEVTESAGEPPPEDPLAGVRCGAPAPGGPGRTTGGKTGPRVHLYDKTNV